MVGRLWNRRIGLVRLLVWLLVRLLRRALIGLRCGIVGVTLRLVGLVNRWWWRRWRARRVDGLAGWIAATRRLAVFTVIRRLHRSPP